MDRPPLDLSIDEFQALAGRVSEAATGYLAELPGRALTPQTSGAQTHELFGGPLPQQGLGAAAFDALDLLAEHSRRGNGGFFGYVFGSGEPVGALADFYASVLNQNVSSWRSAPAAAAVERTTVSWLAEAVGCAGFNGIMTSGGSMANLMALAMARVAASPADGAGRIYASTEAHLSIPRAAAMLGLAPVSSIATDADLRMTAEALDAAVVADRERGLQPVAVVANGGTIATGAIDPLAEIAGVARAHNLWLHVDGAYGLPAAMAIPDAFVGLDQADSMSLDAHKWLYQPLDCSILLFRDPAAARRAFSFSADYVKPLSADSIEGQAFFDESLETSRPFRAFKLWLSLRYHGLAAFRDAISENLRQARLLAELIDAEPALQRLAPVPLSAVCFRWVGGVAGRDQGIAEDLDRVNAQILVEVNRRGRVYLSNATVGGVFALRACITNHRTTDEHLAAVVSEVLAASRGI